MHSNLLTTDLGDKGGTMGLYEAYRAAHPIAAEPSEFRDIVEAEVRRDELIALWAWLKRIEEMKYDMGKHKVVGWDAWTAGSIR